MGLASPLVKAMKAEQDFKKRRQTKSAKPGGGRVLIEPAGTSMPKPSMKHRAPSAPVYGRRGRSAKGSRPASSSRSATPDKHLKATDSKVAFDEYLYEMEEIDYGEPQVSDSE